MKDEPQIAEAQEVAPRPTLSYGHHQRTWWRQPRWHMALGMGCLAFGYGLTLTFWPGPPMIMGLGGFLIGHAIPLPDAGR